MGAPRAWLLGHTGLPASSRPQRHQRLPPAAAPAFCPAGPGSGAGRPGPNAGSAPQPQQPPQAARALPETGWGSGCKGFLGTCAWPRWALGSPALASPLSAVPGDLGEEAGWGPPRRGGLTVTLPVPAAAVGVQDSHGREAVGAGGHGRGLALHRHELHYVVMLADGLGAVTQPPRLVLLQAGRGAVSAGANPEPGSHGAEGLCL